MAYAWSITGITPRRRFATRNAYSELADHIQKQDRGVMRLSDYPLVLMVSTFVGLLACVASGVMLERRWAKLHQADYQEQLAKSRNEIAVLLSLLLGFSLSLVLSRFNVRHELLVEEADAIRTTSLRAELIPEPGASRARVLLRQYVDARLDFSAAGQNEEATRAALEESKKIQRELWQIAKSAVEQRPTLFTSLFVQKLNETIDLNARRLAAQQNRLPRAIWFVLLSLSMLTCLLVGLTQRPLVIPAMLVMPLMISIVFAVIADLDTPKSGLIHIGSGSLERLKTDLNQSSPSSH